MPARRRGPPDRPQVRSAPATRGQQAAVPVLVASTPPAIRVLSDRVWQPRVAPEPLAPTPDCHARSLVHNGPGSCPATQGCRPPEDNQQFVHRGCHVLQWHASRRAGFLGIVDWMQALHLRSFGPGHRKDPG